MKEFKKGQKAYCSFIGKTKIIKINSLFEYPIQIKYKDMLLTFTKDGRYYNNNAPRTLFHSKKEMITYYKKMGKTLVFKDFLKKHDVEWEEFLNNTKEIEFLKKQPPKYWILSAFIWNSIKYKSFDFWSDLDLIWSKKIEKYEFIEFE